MDALPATRIASSHKVCSAKRTYRPSRDGRRTICATGPSVTIDVTPELRGRIKVVAFGRGITVAEMLRDLLTREFPHHPGGTA